jgi:hypothetical protein
MMRIRAGLCFLTCCFAALAGCTAAPSKGPDATVTTPAVGRPPAPVSAQAASSSEAFAPYAELGTSNNDGLAPGESSNALAGPCMNAAGYPGVNVFTQFPVLTNLGGPPGLVFTQPWGGWGYLSAAVALQYGFRFPGPALSAMGIDAGSANPPAIPAAALAAAGRCFSILRDFNNATVVGPMVGIITLSNDISTDMAHDPAVKAAARAWSACMAKNGYSFDQPQAAAGQELQAIYGNGPESTATPVSAATQHAQLAVAVTDAGCTQSSDLAGIYFAVQASYERQLVTANQQALGAAVSAYRAAYAKELKELPALLRTAKAQPFRLAGTRSGAGG